MTRAAVGLPCWDGVTEKSVRQADDHGTDFRMTETEDVIQTQAESIAGLIDNQVLNALGKFQLGGFAFEFISVA
ncbi:hypothetical protein D3C78_1834840 [compost metagenome]